MGKKRLVNNSFAIKAIVVLSILLALDILSVYSFFNSSIRGSEKFISGYMMRESRLLHDNINIRVDNLKAKLKPIKAKLMASNKRDIKFILENSRKAAGIDELYYYEKGNFISAEGRSNLKYNKIKKQINTSRGEKELVGFQKGNRRIYIYYPIKSQKGLLAFYDISSDPWYENVINSDDFTAIFYMPADGNLVNNIESLSFDSENIEEFILNVSNVNTGEKISLQEMLKAQGSGWFVTSLNGIQIRVYYSNLDFDSIYIFTAVEEDVFLKLGMNAVLLAVERGLILLAGFAFILYFGKDIKKALLKGKNMLEKNMKKYEMAISNSNGTLFEYNFKKDALRFMLKSAPKGLKLPREIKNISLNAVSCGLIDEKYKDEFISLLDGVKNGELNLSAEILGGFVFDTRTWLRFTISPMTEPSGGYADAIGAIENITAEKENELKFAQEEQYRKAMLAEAIYVWSANITERRLLTYISKDGLHPKNQDYGPELIDEICENITQEYRNEIKKMLQPESLLALFESGEKKQRAEYKITIADKGEENREIWVTTTINLLEAPSSGDIIAYVYTKSIDKTKLYQMELEFKSSHDMLTKVLNRMAVEDKVNEILSEKDREEKTAGFLMIDVDDFKRVNDTYGHDSGDGLLKQMADKMGVILKEEGIIGRQGGDEFVVFIPNPQSDDVPKEIAYRLINGISQEKFEDIGNESITLSIGIAYYPKDGKNFKELYRKADVALYKAKNNGKNRAEVYTSSNEGA